MNNNDPLVRRAASRRGVLRAALAGATAALGAPSQAAPSSGPIVLGHPYPATGPMAGVADEMKLALDAAAAEINAQGGMRISFDKAQHRGTRFVELAMLSGGRLRR